MSRAMSGKAVAELAIPLMRSRRRIAGSLLRYADDGFQPSDYSKDLRSAEWGSIIKLRCKSLESPMSALGHSRQSRHPGVSGSPQERTFGHAMILQSRELIAKADEALARR